MKICLCSLPVEGANQPLDRQRHEGPLGIVPKTAILSLVYEMQRNGYDSSQYDFYDIDMLYPSDQELIDYFTEYRPDIVGLSAVTSTSYQQVKRISNIVKSVLPKTFIVVGGNITAADEAILRCTSSDICVQGDGEIAWGKILSILREYKTIFKNELLSQIKGISYINENNMYISNGFGEPLPSTTLAFPDYKILASGLKKHPEYIYNHFRKAANSGWFTTDERAKESHRPPNIAGLFLSKGCVTRCTFCLRSTKGYRTVPLVNLEHYLLYLRDNFDVGFIQVMDENFGSDKKHAYEAARIFKKADVLWIATGVRCKSVNEEDLKFYKEHNCSALKFGVESGSQKILDLMEKKFDVDDVYTALRVCAKYNIFSPLAIMVGMPGETLETAKETGRFIGKIALMLNTHPKNLNYDLFYALPFPGTPLYDYGVKSGVLDSTPEGTDKYLTDVSNAGTYKRYYVNLNGATMKEVVFWDWLVKLEASRIYNCNKVQSNDKIVETAFKTNQVLEKNTNPHLSLKYTSITFTGISKFFDFYVEGNKLVDLIPRFIIYPILKYMAYLEYLIQRLFDNNRKHNIFKFNGVKVTRLQVDKSHKKSLRNFLD
jgi:radical SAM superfamily enzyme YgiQ (UPF0313 family)